MQLRLQAAQAAQQQAQAELHCMVNQAARRPGALRRRRGAPMQPRTPVRGALKAAASAGEARQEQRQPDQPGADKAEGQPLPSLTAAQLWQWEHERQRVIAFALEHGWLPRTVANKLGPLLAGERPLGLWCALQQRRKEGSKGSPLSADEAAALLAIPGWSWWATQRVQVGGRVRVPWEQQFREVAAYVGQHGRLPRQTAGKAEPFLLGEKQLGEWCDRQRQRWKGKRQPPLTAEQETALEAIPGWFWEEQVPWEQRCRDMVNFVRQHGRLPRQKACKAEPFLLGEKQLGSWCVRQRQRWKGKKQPPLTAEQETALEAIPGWFWEDYVPWEQRCREVVNFVRQQGRLPRAKACKTESFLPGEKELGVWRNIQRQRWTGTQRPLLTREQQAALATIPGWR